MRSYQPRRRIWLILTGIAVIGSEFPVRAADEQTVHAFLNGNLLLESCRDSTRGGANVCLGYVQGAIDTILLFKGLAVRATQSDTPVLAGWGCFPAGVTAGQGRDIIVRYLESHPERRHISGATQVYIALSEAFPCQ